MIQAWNFAQSLGIPLERILDIGTFQISPEAKMAAILQNGGNKLKKLTKNSALSYVLGGKLYEVTIIINYYAMLCIYITFDSKSSSTMAMLCIYITFDSKSSSTMAYDWQNWPFIIVIGMTGTGSLINLWSISDQSLLYCHTWITIWLQFVVSEIKIDFNNYDACSLYWHSH